MLNKGAHEKSQVNSTSIAKRAAICAGVFVLLFAALYFISTRITGTQAARAVQHESAGSYAASSVPPLYNATAVEKVTAAAAQQAAKKAEADAQLAAVEAAKWRGTDHVEEILQYPDYPSGCEPVSLVILLRSLGFDTSPQDIIENYLITDSDNYEEDYMGDVYDSGGAFPTAMVATANAYLQAQNSTMKADDLTGAPFNSLISIVQTGRPVMIWTTMYMEEPFSTSYYGDDEDEAWYDNEHCVVLYGIDGDDVLVSDPLEGLVRRNAADFATIYEECGSMAMSIF